jgi:drug/metabolite transporter (DMT)-like permease
MMAWPTILCGTLLVFVGVIGYGTADGEARSPTALIPAVVGAILIVCGVLSQNEKRRKHVMHLAAMVGLIGMIGGFMPIRNQYKKTGEFDPTKPSAISGILMVLICGIFVWLCVMSFIGARKARQANAQPPEQPAPPESPAP